MFRVLLKNICVCVCKNDILHEENEAYFNKNNKKEIPSSE